MDRVTAWSRTQALVFSMGLLISACKANARQGPEEQRKDRESYSLGYQVGQNLKKQKVEVNLDIYVSGIRDALQGKKSELNQQEIHIALAGLQKRLASQMQLESKAKAERNLTEGKAFLDENRKNEGVKVLPSGVQYRVLKEGTGKTPKASDAVTVNYRGTLTNGSEFASSYRQSKSQSASLTRVIPGWKEALQLMKEGSKWQLFIPPEQAYGQRGTAGIEPNSTLVFEVELISVSPGENSKE